MEYIVIGFTSLFTAVLTFFSGFGVGTILTPVFVLFFPLDVSIAMTAIVHFLNNLFKLSLTYKDINFSILFKFGIPAIPFAILGAWTLIFLSQKNILLLHFTFLGINCNTYLIQLIVGLLMLFFAIAELMPSFKQTTINHKFLVLGGMFSGFFGGLTGHQGALRTMFLIKSGLSKNTFIATGIAIACIIDISRLGIYFGKIQKINVEENIGIISTATICAFIGAYFGKKLLNKITINTIQYTVSILISIIAILLIFGIV